MSDLIPCGKNTSVTDSISRIELAPVKPADELGVLRRFINAARQIVGLKPLELALRFAEAEVSTRETDNQVKLLKAKQEYELTQAEIRRIDVESQANAAKANAEANAIQAEARSKKANARIREVAAREVERRELTLKQKERLLRDVVEKIRAAGGDVEIAGYLGDEYEREDDGITPTE